MCYLCHMSCFSGCEYQNQSEHALFSTPVPDILPPSSTGERYSAGQQHAKGQQWEESQEGNAIGSWKEVDSKSSKLEVAPGSWHQRSGSAESIGGTKRVHQKADPS